MGRQRDAVGSPQEDEREEHRDQRREHKFRSQQIPVVEMCDGVGKTQSKGGCDDRDQESCATQCLGFLAENLRRQETVGVGKKLESSLVVMRHALILPIPATAGT